MSKDELLDWYGDDAAYVSGSYDPSTYEEMMYLLDGPISGNNYNTDFSRAEAKQEAEGLKRIIEGKLDPEVI